MTPPDSVNVQPGGTARFNCEAKGTPKPDIAWGKDQTGLEIEDRIFVQLLDSGDIEDTSSRLTIYNVQDTDQGTYWCNASSGFYRQDAGAQLDVFGQATPPELAIITRNKPPDVEGNNVVAYLGYDRILRVPFGGKLWVDCPAVGFSSRQWFRPDGRVLKRSGLRQSLANGTLYFSRLATVHPGRYTCQIQNSSATVKETIIIQFNGE